MIVLIYGIYTSLVCFFNQLTDLPLVRELATHARSLSLTLTARNTKTEASKPTLFLYPIERLLKSIRGTEQRSQSLAGFFLFESRNWQTGERNERNALSQRIGKTSKILFYWYIIYIYSYISKRTSKCPLFLYNALC